MATMTITEALADAKTVGKRIEAKVAFIGQYLLRPEQVKDPLGDQGGAVNAIKSAQQAIGDLETRLVNIRLAIQAANLSTALTVSTGGETFTRTIAGWLAYRKDVAPLRLKMLAALRQAIEQQRTALLRQGRATVGAVTLDTSNAKPTDVLVNIDEVQLAKEAEQLDAILSTLDARLNFINATTTITIAD